MSISKSDMTELPPKKASRWVLFLVLTLGIQYLTLTFSAIAKNPPRGEAYREQVIRAIIFSLLPFVWSVFLLIRRRTLGESLVAFASLALSLLWMRLTIWLVENLDAA